MAFVKTMGPNSLWLIFLQFPISLSCWEPSFPSSTFLPSHSETASGFNSRSYLNENSILVCFVMKNSEGTKRMADSKSETSFRCHHCAGPLSKDMETSHWNIPPLIRDSFSMVLAPFFYFVISYICWFALSMEVQMVCIFGFCFVFEFGVFFFGYVIDWLCCWWYNKCLLRVQSWYAYIFSFFLFYRFDLLMSSMWFGFACFWQVI